MLLTLVVLVAVAAAAYCRRKSRRRTDAPLNIVLCGGMGALGQAIKRHLQRTLGTECRISTVDIAIGADHRVDLADSDAVDDLFGAQLSSANALINCSAIVHGHSFMELTATEWRHSIDCNLLAYVNTCRAFLRHCKSPRHIVNVSSVLALAGVPRMADYCATKAAVNGMTEAIRLEHPDVACWTICPFLLLDSALFPSTKSLEAVKENCNRSGVSEKTLKPFWVDIRWPWLTRPLTTEDVACRIVDCLLRGRGKEIVMPSIFALTYAARCVLPTALLDWCQGFVGSTSSIRTSL